MDLQVILGSERVSGYPVVVWNRMSSFNRLSCQEVEFRVSQIQGIKNTDRVPFTQASPS